MRWLLEDPDVAGEGAMGEDEGGTPVDPPHLDIGVGDTPD